MRIDQLYDILLKPVFSEKATTAAEMRKYVFKIMKAANKTQVALAIEKIFSVKVAKVNIVNIPSKRKVFKQMRGVRSGFKKAVVTLKDGYSIDLMA